MLYHPLADIAVRRVEKEPVQVDHRVPRRRCELPEECQGFTAIKAQKDFAQA